MIIAAMALLAVFELQHQLADGQRRYEAALALASLQRDAISLTEDLNPMAEPAGEREMAGGRRLIWRASSLTEIRPQLGYPSGAGQFDVRLYRLDVDILDPHGGRIGGVSLDRLGWRTASATPQAALR
ncbi:MAG TPA: hypothetical protein VIJ94_16495 [Caulobacteraceae bacterium]